MSEEPSNAELGRRLDTITGMLTGLVGRAEYTADQRGIDRRFTELTREIEDIRSQHTSDMRAVGERITEQARTGREGRQHWQQVIIPALVAVVGVAAELYLAARGHKLPWRPDC